MADPAEHNPLEQTLSPALPAGRLFVIGEGKFFIGRQNEILRDLSTVCVGTTIFLMLI